ncbi:hypothetical protein XMD543_001601 [Marinobacterium sp. xm-d-543]|uniref:hypothetical protein n=1 Tax=Marinobacterium sp. xm-d-543 TaxID=2497740 RepID=UPI001568CC22|nr:hypothetical protein [Marinobacterium sp. xm-d-543]NRP47551.1 hypothetical protein [Marinobacterium sp. xm-d-543]
MSELPKSKDEAIRLGLNKYFDGSACKHGHTVFRYVKGGCSECAKKRAEAGRAKQAERRRKINKQNLEKIKRICKSDTCEKVFTPKARKDQVFCSIACADRQGKRDWKQRNSERVRISENERRRKRYQTDERYRQKQIQRSVDLWASLSDDEKYKKGQAMRAALDQSNKRKYFREYQRERAEKDPNFRMASALRARIRAAVKSGGGNKKAKTEELIGCSFEYLLFHLEAQFSEGMSWENYGEWHIDHIKPVAAFSNIGTCEVQQRECFHFSNLQPLWAVENLRKGSKFAK